MKSKSWLILIVVIIGLGLIGFSFYNSFKGSKEPNLTETVTPNESEQLGTVAGENVEPTSSPEISNMEIDKSKKYEATLKTTMGDITVELNASQTPVTVNNFVSLAKKNFYDNTVFHRVIKGFMIQGGDPKGDGTGGPGYTFNDEKFEGEYKRGILAMANSGPNTNGSQFFIMQSDYTLPKNYVIFGKVIKGIEIVDKIAEAPVEKNSFGEPSKPVTPVKVKSVEIIEK